MQAPALKQSDYQLESGRRLRWLIDKMDIKYTQAAEMMGVSKHVLRNWMAGDNAMQPYAIYRLCLLKRVDFNWIFLGDWSRLPAELAGAAEAEVQAILAGEPAPEHPEAGKPKIARSVTSR